LFSQIFPDLINNSFFIQALLVFGCSFFYAVPQSVVSNVPPEIIVPCDVSSETRIVIPARAGESVILVVIPALGCSSFGLGRITLHADAGQSKHV
jgi:hypothetical protein